MFCAHQFRLGRDVVTAHGGAARSRRQQTAQDANGGRLPRPVGSQKTENLAARDVDRNIVDGDEIAEALDQVLDMNSGTVDWS